MLPSAYGTIVTGVTQLSAALLSRERDLTVVAGRVLFCLPLPGTTMQLTSANVRRERKNQNEPSFRLVVVVVVREVNTLTLAEKNGMRSKSGYLARSSARLEEETDAASDWG